MKANLGWLNKHRSDDIGAVGLVADSEAANDGAKMQSLIITDSAESQLVVATTLNDG